MTADVYKMTLVIAGMPDDPGSVTGNFGWVRKKISQKLLFFPAVAFAYCPVCVGIHLQQMLFCAVPQQHSKGVISPQTPDLDAYCMSLKSSMFSMGQMSISHESGLSLVEMPLSQCPRDERVVIRTQKLDLHSISANSPLLVTVPWSKNLAKRKFFFLGSSARASLCRKVGNWFIQNDRSTTELNLHPESYALYWKHIKIK